jgi:DNA-binding IclR family transcriptional regulator
VNEPVPASPTDAIRSRICGEYLEMPGLQLTCAQAQRLWGLDQPTCVAILQMLIGDGFLQQRPDGRYSRLTDGAFAFPAMRMAKATVGRVCRSSFSG